MTYVNTARLQYSREGSEVSLQTLLSLDGPTRSTHTRQAEHLQGSTS